MTVSPASPTITTTSSRPAPPWAASISDTATVSGGYNPSGTVTFTLYNNPNGTGTPLYTDTGAAERRHGLFGQLHDVGDGHGLLGGHVQRRQQQQHGHQRHVRRAGDDQPGQPDDHDDRSGQRHRGRIDLRHGDGQRRLQPERHGHLHAVQQRHGTAPRCTPTPRPLSGGTAPRAATRRRRRARTTGWPRTAATATTTGDQRHVRRAGDRRHRSPRRQTPATAYRGRVDLRHGDGQRRSARQRHGDLHAVQQPQRHAARRCTPTPRPLSGGTAPLGSYTTTATGTDYWVATYNGDSNNNTATSGVGRAGDGQRGEPDDHDDPDSRPRLRGRVDLRHGDGQRRLPAERHGDLHAVQQSQRTARRCTPTPRPYPGSGGTARPLRAATRQRRRAPTTGWPRTTATATTTRAPAARPRAGVRSARPADHHEPAAGQRPWAGRSPTRRRSAAVNPSGTVTFTLYSNPTRAQPARRCSPTPRPRSERRHGQASSAGYTTSATGTDYWVATYNGDSNNTAAPAAHGRAGEPSTAISTTQHAGHERHVGGSISDTATVSGGYPSAASR